VDVETEGKTDEHTDRETGRYDESYSRFFWDFVNAPKIDVVWENIGNRLTLRRLMSYIYMEHPFLMFLDHTQRRTTVG